MNSRLLIILFFYISSSSVCASDNNKDTQQHNIPPWFLEHIEYLTKNGGTWIADNSDYKSEQEKHDFYASHWQKGIGGKSFTGRLYGITDGKESGTFWEFRAFWHPGQKRVIMQQFGANGAFGTGTLINIDNNNARGQQTFYSVDGSSFEGGHSFIFEEEKQDTSSYTILSDGSWKKNRTYIWYRTTHDSAQ